MRQQHFCFRIEEVERTLADQRALQEDARVKMEGTIKQQTKLIDFLQSKMDTKKKKVCKKLQEALHVVIPKENTLGWFLKTCIADIILKAYSYLGIDVLQEKKSSHPLYINLSFSYLFLYLADFSHMTFVP